MRAARETGSTSSTRSSARRLTRHDARVAGPRDRVDAADDARAAAERHHRDVVLAAPVEHARAARPPRPGRRRRRAGAGTRRAARARRRGRSGPGRARARDHGVAARSGVSSRGGASSTSSSATGGSGSRSPKPRWSARPAAAARSSSEAGLLVLVAPAPVLATALGHGGPPYASTIRPTVSYPPGILARGPWQADQVASRWREDPFEPPAARTEAADEAIAALEDRGSPAHDGLAARLADFRTEDGRLELELQPMRWSLRLVRERRVGLAGRAVRDALGRRPLAGRPPRAVGRVVGRALGARRRRGGRGRREPGRDARARARGGVVGDARAPDRRGARRRCRTGW